MNIAQTDIFVLLEILNCNLPRPTPSKDETLPHMFLFYGSSLGPTIHADFGNCKILDAPAIEILLEVCCPVKVLFLWAFCSAVILYIDY